MNKVIAVLFAIACFSTSYASNSLLGPGFWFYAIIATGLFVVISQYAPLLRDLGRAAALVLGVIAICAVLLTLLAATIGGSFSLDNREALLVFSFTMIAVFGITLYKLSPRG